MDPKKTSRTTNTAAVAEPEPFEPLATLARKNGFRSRQMYAFVEQGLRVVRPGAGRVAYSRQSWLDEFFVAQAAASVASGGKNEGAS